MHSGKTLRLLRQYKEVSQEELGRRTGKSQELISYYEQQKHLNGETVELMLKALNSNREEWEKFRKITLPE